MSGYRMRSRVVLSLVVGVAYVVTLAVSAMLGHAPWALAIACMALSAIAFIVYGLDKRAAVNHRRRVPESQLHFIALLGGWPGALVARQTFRHKTVKQPFRTIFWFTVAGNAGLVALFLMRVWPQL